MSCPMVLLLLAALSAAPASSLEAPERAAAIVRAEMALEKDHSERSGLVLLIGVPVLSGEPAIDGAIDDAFWKEATTVLWEDPEGAPFRFAPGWTFHFAWTERGLFVGGRRTVRGEESEVLLIPLSSGGSVALKFAATGASATFFGSRGSPSSEDAGTRFAARGSPEKPSFELSLPRGKPLWPDGPDPLRIPWISSARGNPPQVRLSPVFQMARAEKGTRWAPPASLSGAKRDSIEPEEARLRERLERRRAFFARLPAEFDRVLLVKGPPGVPAGRLCVVSLWSGEERDIILLPQGALARDPCLSPAGDEVVFALDKGAEGTHLQIVSLSGGSPRVLTPLDGSRDVQPCWTSSGVIVFVSNRAKTESRLTLDASCLHAVREDGSELRRISFHPHGDAAPVLLSDGRVAFQRWVKAPVYGLARSAIWVMNPDGSHLAGLLGRYDGISIVEPQPIYGTTRLACILRNELGRMIHDPPPDGLGVVDLAAGAPEFRYGPALGPWDPLEAVSVGSDAILVSAHLQGAAAALYLVDSGGNCERLGASVEHSFSGPVPLLPRARPPALSPVRPFGSDPASRMATLVVADVRRGLPEKVQAAARWVRVVSVPDSTGEDPYGDVQFKTLGWAPVHADGSAHFRVPSRVALRFAVLDENGRELSAMQNPISFAPGEHRSCIGCHEERTLAPPVAKRGRLMALDGPPASLAPEPMTHPKDK